MANNYSDLDFNVSAFDNLNVTIAYKLNKIDSSLTKLIFPFSVVFSELKQNEVSVQEWLDNLEFSVLRRVQQLLGRNVKISYLEITNTTKNQSFKQNYSNLFGSADGLASQLALLFELLPEGRSNALRYYLRHPATSYCSRLALPAELEKTLEEFELVFIKPLEILQNKVALRYERQTSTQKRRIISATLKSAVQIIPTRARRSQPPAKSKSRPKQSTKKLSRLLVAA